jgi:hypothetical protein
MMQENIQYYLCSDCHYFFRLEPNVFFCPNCNEKAGDYRAACWEFRNLFDIEPLGVFSFLLVSAAFFLIVGEGWMYWIGWLASLIWLGCLLWGLRIIFLWMRWQRVIKSTPAQESLNSLQDKLSQRLDQCSTRIIEIDTLLGADDLDKPAMDALQAAKEQVEKEKQELSVKAIEIDLLRWQSRIKYLSMPHPSNRRDEETRLNALFELGKKGSGFQKDLDEIKSSGTSELTERINCLVEICNSIERARKHERAFDLVREVKASTAMSLSPKPANQESIYELASKVALDEKDALQSENFLRERLRLEALVLLEKE